MDREHTNRFSFNLVLTYAAIPLHPSNSIDPLRRAYRHRERILLYRFPDHVPNKPSRHVYGVRELFTCESVSASAERTEAKDLSGSRPNESPCTARTAEDVPMGQPELGLQGTGARMEVHLTAVWTFAVPDGSHRSKGWGTRRRGVLEGTCIRTAACREDMSAETCRPFEPHQVRPCAVEPPETQGAARRLSCSADPVAHKHLFVVNDEVSGRHWYC